MKTIVRETASDLSNANLQLRSGGLGLGIMGTSDLFLLVTLTFLIYLTKTKRD